MTKLSRKNDKSLRNPSHCFAKMSSKLKNKRLLRMTAGNAHVNKRATRPAITIVTRPATTTVIKTATRHVITNVTSHATTTVIKSAISTATRPVISIASTNATNKVISIHRIMIKLGMI